jgi:hypothetical protein
MLIGKADPDASGHVVTAARTECALYHFFAVGINPLGE